MTMQPTSAIKKGDRKHRGLLADYRSHFLRAKPLTSPRTSLHSMRLGPKIFGVHLDFFGVRRANERKTFGVRNLFSSWRAKLYASQA